MEGITFEKDKNGENRYVRFDLKQHGERFLRYWKIWEKYSLPMVRTKL